jgi:hypothetical protein
MASPPAVAFCPLSSVIRERFGDTVFTFYSLNPMVGVIDGFRWALLGGHTTIYWPGFCVQPSILDKRAGANPASAIGGWAE